MDVLDIISKIAPIISALTAIIAAIFITRQISNIRRNREVDSLFKLIALSDNELIRQAKEWVIFDLKKHMTLPQLMADKEAMKKISSVIHLFETMGVLVNNGYLPEKLVFDKYGLLVIGMWGRLQPLISAMRIDMDSYEYAENFELLVHKYDNWAKKNPLKIAKGERMMLKEGRKYLDYEGKNYEQNNHIGS